MRTIRSVPLSPPQAAPATPSIWRTFAFGVPDGKPRKLSVAGSKRTIALAGKSVSLTSSERSTQTE